MEIAKILFLEKAVFILLQLLYKIDQLLIVDSQLPDVAADQVYFL